MNMPSTDQNILRGFARNLRHEAEELEYAKRMDAEEEPSAFKTGESAFSMLERGRPPFADRGIHIAAHPPKKLKNMTRSFTFFCNGEKLEKQPLYDGAPSEKAIKLKDPLLITVPYFRLKFRSGDFANQEVLITTFSKSGVSNQIGSEFVNYYSKDVVFQDGTMDCQFGPAAHIYGNDFLFYMDSYTGEDINLTIKAIEIDNHDNAFKNIYKITNAASSASSLLCIEALPYIAGINAAMGLLEKLIKILDKDDLISRCPFKLFHEQEHFPELLQGRYVCIFPSSSMTTEADLAGNWKLSTNDHKLRNSAGEEYLDGSYFVISVSKKKSDKYHKFDRQLGAAGILSRVNASDGNMDQLMTALTEMATQVSDFRMMDEIDKLMSEFTSTGNDELQTKARALFLNLSTNMKSFAVNKYDTLKE